MSPHSDACERNKEPILNVLRHRFAQRKRVLEIGSGTGQHAVHFARNLAHLSWQPTERLELIEGLKARIDLEGSRNLLPPLVLDVAQAVWPVSAADAIFTANTLHIMSWREVVLAFEGLTGLLAAAGELCIYGPFRYGGRYTSPSNEDFDRMLQQRDPLSGLRDIDSLLSLAAPLRLRLDADYDLPANNRLLAFVKEPG